MPPGKMLNVGNAVFGSISGLRVVPVRVADVGSRAGVDRDAGRRVARRRRLAVAGRTAKRNVVGADLADVRAARRARLGVGVIRRDHLVGSGDDRRTVETRRNRTVVDVGVRVRERQLRREPVTREVAVLELELQSLAALVADVQTGNKTRLLIRERSSVSDSASAARTAST